MNKGILIFALVSFSLFSFAQKDMKKYIKQNAVEIQTIQPDFDDFSDFEAIGNAIGNSRVVMLGEASHGDGSTFLAKTRLVKYLHEKKGFNVLAFESDFYALNRKWDLLSQNKIQSDSFYFTENIHSVWTKCDSCNYLFYDYLPSTLNTSNQIIIAGFDNQIFGKYSIKNFAKDIDTFLVSNNISFTSKESYKKIFLPLIDSFIGRYYEDSTRCKLMILLIDSIENELMFLPVKDEFFFLCFKNYKQFMLQILASHRNDWIKGSNIRDLQMANNFNWIMNTKYPNEKIIVWAHSGHIIKKSSYYFYETSNYRFIKSMGEYITDDSSVRAMTYVLGFTSNQGNYGNTNQVSEIFKPRKYSFENWMPRRLNYGFVDFKKYNQLNPVSRAQFNMKCINHMDLWLDWTNAFDGIFYIKEMNSCRKPL